VLPAGVSDVGGGGVGLDSSASHGEIKRRSTLSGSTLISLSERDQHIRAELLERVVYEPGASHRLDRRADRLAMTGELRHRIRNPSGLGRRGELLNRGARLRWSPPGVEHLHQQPGDPGPVTFIAFRSGHLASRSADDCPWSWASSNESPAFGRWAVVWISIKRAASRRFDCLGADGADDRLVITRSTVGHSPLPELLGCDPRRIDRARSAGLGDAHSQQELAVGTYKDAYGFHPLGRDRVATGGDP
jgi:hypothetical protein